MSLDEDSGVGRVDLQTFDVVVQGLISRGQADEPYQLRFNAFRELKRLALLSDRALSDTQLLMQASAFVEQQQRWRSHLQSMPATAGVRRMPFRWKVRG